ncbi:MAG TPA: hypothetical protein VF053_05505, partial [Streptosporangiales bacterium]
MRATDGEHVGRRGRRRARERLVLVAAALFALLVGTLPAGAVRASAAPAGGFDSGPAMAALVRIVGADRAAQVTLRALERGDGPDRFQVLAEDGHL